VVKKQKQHLMVKTMVSGYFWLRFSQQNQWSVEGRDQLGVPGSGSMRWSPAQVFSAGICSA
jgi:hypothetical protein